MRCQGKAFKSRSTNRTRVGNILRTENTGRPSLTLPFTSLLPPVTLPSLSLKVGPLNPARGLGSAVSSPAGFETEPQTKSNLMHFTFYIWYLVATLLMIFLTINLAKFVKTEYYQNSSMLDCVTQCSQSAAHLHEQFLQVQQIGFVTLGRLRSV